MERKRAKLVILHGKGDARLLREIEGSNSRYQSSGNESTRRVVITQASTALIRRELSEIGLIIQDVATIEKVAKKFDIELVKKPGGKLALDDTFGLGLCEILEYEKQ
ncbi:MAG: hypothetical protein WCN88_00825 [Candidatus Falkowbacteria bacterium]